jgi:hypothetical protein
MLAGALAAWCGRLVGSARVLAAMPANLLSAPLTLGGEWGGSAPNDAAAVLSRMREACLSGIRLLSDRQPVSLRVDDHATGPPHIWLHADHPDTAWIVVDIGSRDWCKLAYQFGHELGHVLCNSWQIDAKPQRPTQWLEEALAEAHSLRGLALLADGWERNSPFPNDTSFAKAIRQYREGLIENYRKAAGPPPGDEPAAWFHANRALLEGGHHYAPPVILAIMAELIADRHCVEDLGAVNRWPMRSSVPVEAYLALWENSCAEIKASGKLPARLKSLLQLS